MSAPFSCSALRVRPTLVAAAFLTAVLGFDVVRERFARPVAASASGKTVRVGDRVGYRGDGLTYEVIEVRFETALIRRGDDMMYADRSELLFGR